MTINIFTSMNGVGLQSDYELLKSCLTDHEVNLCDYLAHKPVKDCDIAFHLEIPRFPFLKQAKRNIFIPNAEWFYPYLNGVNWSQRLPEFDEVWAKTKDCERIFKLLHKNVKLSGFISKDLSMKYVPKQMVLLHVAGQSKTKNTQVLCEAYKKHADLPKCYLISSGKWECSHGLVPCERLHKEYFDLMLNSCLIHVCPSQYEGWGHYIHEAFSVGAFVLTCDAPPMNEFVSEYLVPVKEKMRLRLADTAIINADDLAEKIREVYELGEQKLTELGKLNRIKYENECNDFKVFLRKEL